MSAIGKWVGGVLALFLLLVSAAGLWLWLSLSSIEVEQLSDDLYVLRGAQSGNVAVLATGKGSVVVDSMISARQGSLIAAKALQLTGEPVRWVINTHYHLDHSYGNAGFEGGVRFLASERTAHWMQTFSAEYWSGDNADKMPAGEPETLSRLQLGRHSVQLIHSLPAHTDGDWAVYFEDERVLHTGDLFFNQHYPNIDLEAGGSIRQWSAAIDQLLALDFERVIPGHGATTDRKGLKQFQAFMQELWVLGETAAKTGQSLKEAQINGWLQADQGYEELGIPLVFRLDRDFVIQQAWREANRYYQGGKTLAAP